MRHLVLFVVILAGTACAEKKSDLTIPAAKVRAALALSAFECSALAGQPAESTRLFNAGLLAGRDFLKFADSNNNGFNSISSQIDPMWGLVAERPSADFKLGEIYAAMRNRIDAERRGDERDWQSKRDQWYTEKNCAFVASEPAAK